MYEKSAHFLPVNVSALAPGGYAMAEGTLTCSGFTTIDRWVF
ncbi:MAG: hypothetical protein XXXJIFNMEKO3_01885 [Candidatus Erwinia impunctatus]|nr:hypothetical protein XXXJIFNMEKO_01885 [Culicoides impunctatus]